MNLLGDILMVGICLLAWLKGERAERAGAVLLFSTWIGSTLARAAISGLPYDLRVGLVASLSLGGDFLLATGLLVLAIRHSSLWLGSVLLIQGATLTLHAMFMDQQSGWHEYALISNLLSWLFLLMILVGVLGSWRRRVVRRSAELRDREGEVLSRGLHPSLSPAI